MERKTIHGKRKETTTREKYMNDRGIENLYLGREKRDREKEEQRVSECVCVFVCEREREREKWLMMEARKENIEIENKKYGKE